MWTSEPSEECYLKEVSGLKFGAVSQILALSDDG
jgi:hypothetical protein